MSQLVTVILEVSVDMACWYITYFKTVLCVILSLHQACIAFKRIYPLRRKVSHSTGNS